MGDGMPCQRQQIEVQPHNVSNMSLTKVAMAASLIAIVFGTASSRSWQGKLKSLYGISQTSPY